MKTPITIKCRLCGKDKTMEVDRDDIARWHSGALIQNAFPYLDANQRELLQTQTCSECWAGMFEYHDSPEAVCEKCGAILPGGAGCTHTSCGGLIVERDE